MNPNTHNRLVLDFMVMRAMKVTDSVPVDIIMDYGIDKGLSLGEVEAALITPALRSGFCWSGRMCICRKQAMRRWGRRMTTRILANSFAAAPSQTCCLPRFRPACLGDAVGARLASQN